MSLRTIVSGCLVTIISVSVGCGDDQGASHSPGTSTGGTHARAAEFLLTSEPEGARTVIETRESAQADDEVVVVGRIGGGMDPWVEGLAAFSIVDPSLKSCSDIPGDSCPTPWDYCCEIGSLKTSTALVKIVDDDGRVVSVDAQQLLNVKPLDRVVVRGKAQRDEEGNLIVLATGVHVQN